MLLAFAFLLSCAFVLIGTVPLLWALVCTLSDFTDVPLYTTPARYYEKIANALAIGEGDTVYELGSGDGGFLIWCAPRYPHASFVGVELNWLLIRVARFRVWLRRLTNVRFVQTNVFDTRYHEATKIFAYMLPPVLRTILPRLDAEFRGRVASRAFRLEGRMPRMTIELSTKAGSHGQHQLFVYDFPSRDHS